MQTVSSVEAKTKFGQLLDMAQKGPVAVEKHGRPVSVMISYEDFEHYQALEDKMWALAAKEAETEGYLSSKDSDDFLESL